jgi:hypothetical protein
MFTAASAGHHVASGHLVRGIRTFILFVMITGTALVASAVTLDQVIALKKAGVTDAVVLALIERDRAVFSIQPEQIVALQRDGLSEALIIAMLKSGQAADEAARAESAYTSAMIAAAIAPAPEVLIVGHGPERPNTYHPDGFFTNTTSPYLIPPYGYGNAYGYGNSRYARPYDYGLPYGLVDGLPYARRGGRRSDFSAQPRALCYAQVNSSASRGNSLTFVTECPAVLQPTRKLAR